VLRALAQSPVSKHKQTNKSLLAAVSPLTNMASPVCIQSISVLNKKLKHNNRGAYGEVVALDLSEKE
jgi:hypothetical protein